MRTLKSENTALLFIDFQARLMRVIDGADDVIANAKRLLDAAALLGVPALFTEQNPTGLGSTVEALPPLREQGNRDPPHGAARRRNRHHRDGGFRVARHRRSSALPRSLRAGEMNRRRKAQVDGALRFA